MDRQYRVGVLGATGAVGQQFVRLLHDHPWFELTALAASPRSAGMAYKDATEWIGETAIPDSIADNVVVPTEPDAVDCDFVFSGLSANVAGDVEKSFAAAGIPVISNAKNYRMDETVPLLIPEVNPDHIDLIHEQDWSDGGFIVTNPNCSTVGMVCALAPLVESFGVEAVQVTTMQALSGAGYPGVSSLDALGNVVPYIGGEEDKMASEPHKIFGSIQNGRIKKVEFPVSAQCNRVPVLEGHLATVSVRLGEDATVQQLKESWSSFASPLSDENLPTAPEKFLQVDDNEYFPQPRRHAMRGGGMTVSIGRVRPCPVLDYKFVVLVHNTVRGAAGGALLNAELLAKKGFLKATEALA